MSLSSSLSQRHPKAQAVVRSVASLYGLEPLRTPPVELAPFLWDFCQPTPPQVTWRGGGHGLLDLF